MPGKKKRFSPAPLDSRCDPWYTARMDNTTNPNDDMETPDYNEDLFLQENWPEWQSDPEEDYEADIYPRDHEDQYPEFDE
jgi:hypothetical protein